MKFREACMMLGLLAATAAAYGLVVAVTLCASEVFSACAAALAPKP